MVNYTEAREGEGDLLSDQMRAIYTTVQTQKKKAQQEFSAGFFPLQACP